MLDLDELQRACNYLLVRKWLKPASTSSIVFGAIAIVVGLGGVLSSPIDGVLALIGAFLVVHGMLIRTAPTLRGIVVDAIALIVLGIWNIVVGLANYTSEGIAVWEFFVIFGILQIIWGGHTYGQYRRFSKLPRSEPSQETLNTIADTVSSIMAAKTKETPGMIEFKAATFAHTAIWRGRLAPDSAVFVQCTGDDVIFAAKDDVHIQKQGKARLGKAIKTKFRLGEWGAVGTMLPEYWERYEAWKQAPSGA